MGQIESKPSYYRQVQNEEGNFVIVTNDPIDTFEFDSSQSHLVSYGIDYQTSPKFKHKTLSSITGTDAKLVCDSLVDIRAFQPQNTAVYVASKQVDDCTFAGIKKTFQECAAKVGPNGLLIFHFSGHGIKVGDDEWGLAPVDFDYSRSTYLTASVLISWINDIQCKAKHILFTLDCCYAGGIGTELTKSVEVQIDANICVMSACAGYETSLVIGPLKNSIFVYFLCDTILNCRFQAGLLPIKEIFSRCQVCCQNLSSLLVRYRADTGLLSPTLMQPQMGVLHLKTTVQALLGEGDDQVDAGIGRFEYAISLYERKKPTQLSEKTFAYLETVSSLENGPLLQLRLEGVLTQLVLNAAVCSMMYSVASNELVNNPRVVATPNHSITAFINCVAAIDMIHSGVEFDEYTFFVSWLFYREVLVENKVDVSSLNPLFHRLQSTCCESPKDVKQEDVDNGSLESTDFTDFADVSVFMYCIATMFIVLYMLYVCTYVQSWE